MAKKPIKKAEPTEGISTLFGLVEIPKEEEIIEKKIGPFQFIDAISNSKEYLFSDETQKDYAPYTVNKALSAFPDTLMDAVFLNSNYHLDKKMQHDYLFYKVKKRKRWKEWLKKSASEKEHHSLMESFAKVSNINMKIAEQYWRLMTETQQIAWKDKYLNVDKNK